MRKEGEKRTVYFSVERGNCSDTKKAVKSDYSPYSRWKIHVKLENKINMKMFWTGNME